MKQINLNANKTSFQICTPEGIKTYNINEILFIRHGSSSDHSGREREFDEYKIRIPINRLGQFRTYAVRFYYGKNSWFISENVCELFSMHIPILP